jgi:hypothetical protein
MKEEIMLYFDWDNIHAFELINGHPRDGYEPAR